MTTSTKKPTDTPIDPKIKTIRDYQEKVVDLSRRNRLLKYPLKARRISFDLSLQDFHENYGMSEDFSMEFLHKLVLAQDEDGSQLPLFHNKRGRKNENQKFTPITTPKGEKLLNAFISLRLDAKRKFEEHGLNTLFLTIGKIKWKEKQTGRGSSDASDEWDYNAPLLLIPIKIEDYRQPIKKTVIRQDFESGEISVNPILRLFLERQYGIVIPDLEIPEEVENISILVNKFVTKFKKAFSDSKIKHNIDLDIEIGQYSFYGQQIYEDLRDNEEEIADNPFITSLCEKASLTQKNFSDVEPNPERLLDPEEDFSILDADVSQLEVIQKVIWGQSMVVQGPPGTGKSQTIVNLVSNLLARGKSVLVVCEKHVALEVVLKRLKDAGLDKLCLPLFQFSTDKSRFAKSIIEDRNYIIKNFSSENRALHSSLELRQKSINKLKDYAKTLSKIIEPLGRNVFWVHGELSRMQSINSDDPILWKGNDLQAITFPEYQELITLTANIAPILKKKEENAVDYWQSIKKEHFSPDYATRVFQALSDAKRNLSSLIKIKPDLLPIHSVSDIKKAVELKEKITSILPLDLHNLGIRTDTSIEDVITGLKKLNKMLSLYEKTNSSLAKKYLVPESWYLPNQSHFDGLNDNVLIVDIEKAEIELKATEDSLKFTKKFLSQNKADYLIALPINELSKYIPLFELDSVLKKLSSWNNIGSLKSAAESIGVLYAIYQKLESAKLEFEKRAITFADLNESEALVIADRFQEKYKYFFRFIFPQYKKDCMVIASWCGVEVPVKFADFNKIVLSVQDCFRLTTKFKALLSQFNQKWTQKKDGVGYASIPGLHTNLSRLIDWLTLEGKEELPPQLFKFIETNLDNEDLKTLPLSLNSISKLLNNFLKVFNLNDSLSFNEIESKRRSLDNQIKNIIQNYRNVVEILPENQPKTVDEMKSDIAAINQLADVLKTVSKKELDDLFHPETSLREIVGLSLRFNKEGEKLEKISGAVSKFIPESTALSLSLFNDLLLKLNEKSILWEQPLEQYETSISNLDGLFETEGSLAHLELLNLSEQDKSLTKMNLDVGGLENQMNFARYAHVFRDKGHEWFLKDINGKSIANLSALFAQSLWNAWLDNYYRKNPALRDFNILEHKKVMADFKALEREVLKINAARVMGKVGPIVKSHKLHCNQADERYLVHQSELQRRHKPIRQVVTNCPDHLQGYKPCWMMSPLTLSSYIPYGKMNFDVVIFDEASQMRVEHALGAIARAGQVVIFGDEHQLPPTSFFEVTSEGDEESEEEQDFESILHASKTVLPNADESLLYHYRSKHEDLIAFCNYEVYDGRLITFPNPTISKSVGFVHVADGVFDGAVSREGYSGTRRNDIEAKRVAEVCAQHAADYPDKSIGVIAFSKSQELAIRDAVINLLETNPEVRDKLNEDDPSSDAFFIKNLESVQGDERDIIVLSIGYARDKNGDMHNRFGPINARSGYRRLNVAFTRAKEKIVCVSSIKATDIRPGPTARGAKMLQHYLDYAENGPAVLVSSLLVQNNAVDVDSPFELDVEKALMDRGYKIERQVGASGYKIDLAVIDPKNDGQYILGIECDGATYHSSYSARVNDRLRQDVLERLGWKIYRVWSQHWITHKSEIVDDITRSISKI